MNWTDERVERLKKLWADGLSASQIAAQLGGVSRNAVIGKVHRLNLPGRAKSGGQAAARTKRATAAPRAPNYASRGQTSTNAVSRTSMGGGASAGGATALKQDFEVNTALALDTRPVQDVVVPISRRLSLIELSERTCKWPIGDPATEEFWFCGLGVQSGKPYCEAHVGVAFQPMSSRRDRRR